MCATNGAQLVPAATTAPIIDDHSSRDSFLSSINVTPAPMPSTIANTSYMIAYRRRYESSTRNSRFVTMSSPMIVPPAPPSLCLSGAASAASLNARM